jgi:hypothetical protein
MKQQRLGFGRACAALYASSKISDGNVRFQLKLIAWSGGRFRQMSGFR